MLLARSVVGVAYIASPEMVDSVADITGLSRAEAQLLLDNAGGDVGRALARHFGLDLSCCLALYKSCFAARMFARAAALSGMLPLARAAIDFANRSKRTSGSSAIVRARSGRQAAAVSI